MGVTSASSEDDAARGYRLAEAAKDFCSCCWSRHFVSFVYKFGAVRRFLVLGNVVVSPRESVMRRQERCMPLSDAIQHLKSHLSYQLFGRRAYELMRNFISRRSA